MKNLLKTQSFKVHSILSKVSLSYIHFPSAELFSDEQKNKLKSNEKDLVTVVSA